MARSVGRRDRTAMAVTFTAPRRVELVAVDLPAPGEGEVLVQPSGRASAGAPRCWPTEGRSTRTGRSTRRSGRWPARSASRSATATAAWGGSSGRGHPGRGPPCVRLPSSPGRLRGPGGGGGPRRRPRPAAGHAVAPGRDRPPGSAGRRRWSRTSSWHRASAPWACWWRCCGARVVESAEDRRAVAAGLGVRVAPSELAPVLADVAPAGAAAGRGQRPARHAARRPPPPCPRG